MLHRRKLKNILVWTILLSILVFSFLMVMPKVAIGVSLPRANYQIYLPLFLYTESPPMVTVYVINELGINLSFEIVNTGVGRKTIPPGEHLYGSFPPGSYRTIIKATGYETLDETVNYSGEIFVLALGCSYTSLDRLKIFSIQQILKSHRNLSH